jgi:hypothetical protein
VVDPDGTSSGTATVRIYDVVDVTGTIVANTLPVPVSLTTPGQRAVLSFTGTAGRRMAVKVVNTAGDFGCTWYIRLQKDNVTLPNGSQGSCTGGGPSAFLEPELPSDGTYTVVVDPEAHRTGSASVYLYDVADFTGSITVNGAAVPVDLLTPGQRGQLTFSGTTGQSVRVNVTTTNGGFGCSWYILIQKNDVTIPGGSTASCAGINQTATLGPVSLPSDGTFTVVVDPQTSSTGSATVTLTQP